MMIYEINDTTFLMKSIQSPNPAFDISEYVSLSISSTRSHNRKLSHKIPGLWNKLVDVEIFLTALFQLLIKDDMS
uniref:Uncharacterized protein n=1 Tax=Amphimedon queenslandica TaxID=400682 RepID=A0A1X7UQA7_AMPQE